MMYVYMYMHTCITSNNNYVFIKYVFIVQGITLMMGFKQVKC